MSQDELALQVNSLTSEELAREQPLYLKNRAAYFSRIIDHVLLYRRLMNQPIVSRVDDAVREMQNQYGSIIYPDLRGGFSLDDQRILGKPLLNGTKGR